jgi:drug/metabolite transporter (DMT)-like permease
MVANGTRLFCTAPAAHAAVIGAQLVWSSWTVLSKRLMGTGSDPIIFATCRELGCALVLCMATAVQRWVSREPSSSYTRREVFLLVCCGVAMGAMQLTFLLGVRKVDATTASLSNLLIPILTLVTTGVLGWEPLPLCGARCSALCPSYTKVAGVLCACAGCAVLIYNPTGALDGAHPEGEMQYLVGCAFLLLSSCGSVAFVLTQKALLRRHGELEVLTAAYALASVSLAGTCAAYYVACKQAPAMALGRFTLGREELVALAFTVSFVGVGAYCLMTDCV